MSDAAAGPGMPEADQAMTSTRWVTAIIPTCNRAAFLPDAIESILRQHHDRLEIIVVDDGSTDGTAAVARQFSDRVRYVYQTNAGPAAARNRGIALARGDVIGFLDSDDLWTERKLDFQVSYLDHDPAVDIVLGYSQVMRRTPGLAAAPEFARVGEPKLVWSVGCALVRRSVFDRVGLFDAKLRYWEDEDWFRRAREAGTRIVCLTHATQCVRYHDDNMTHDMTAGHPDLLRFLKNHRDRRLRARETEPSR